MEKEICVRKHKAFVASKIDICRRTATTSHVDAIDGSLTHTNGINDCVVDIEVAAGAKEKEFYGVLKAYDDDSVTIENEQGQQTFQKSEIALIRLAFDF